MEASDDFVEAPWLSTWLFNRLLNKREVAFAKGRRRENLHEAAKGFFASKFGAHATTASSALHLHIHPHYAGLITQVSSTYRHLLPCRGVCGSQSHLHGPVSARYLVPKFHVHPMLQNFGLRLPAKNRQK